MNSNVENAKRQILTKRSVVGFIKQLVPALVAALCCLSAVAEAEDITEDRTLTQNTTIENISGGGTGIKHLSIDTNGKTLTLNNTEDSYFGGKITGPGNVVKTGSGTIYFQYQPSGIQTVYPAFFMHTGTTTVSEGTLNMCSSSGAISGSSQVIINKNGAIETSFDQRFNNLSGSGTIKVDSNAILDLVNSVDSEFSGVITGPTSLEVGQPMFGPGVSSGTLTLSGTLNNVTSITLRNKSQLKLTGAALNYNGTMTVNGGKSVEYNVVSGSKRYNINNDNKIDVRATQDGGADSGKLIKSGDGALQICCEADKAVRADSVFISSGRMDYQGYFYSELGSQTRGSSGWVPSDIVVVESGATLSPGIGIGDMTVTQGNVKIKNGAKMLFEFGDYDAYSENQNPSQQYFDTLVLKLDYYYFELEANSIIDLDFLNNDAWKWAKEDAVYQLVADQGFANGNYDALLPEKYRSMFSLQGLNNNGLYLIGLGAPDPNAVPEPSTWALMILGVAGLLCLKKLQKK